VAIRNGNSLEFERQMIRNSIERAIGFMRGKDWN
jgi:hypothetical protein